jgi:TRAP-type C4-dicarboxylate transport system permease small subunit
MAVQTTKLNGIDVFIKYWLSVIIIAVTVLASCSMLLQVITRYIFDISISGLDEMTGHTAVWMYLMGAAYGSFERTQIKAEMIHLFIKNDRLLNGVRSLATTIAAVVAGYMVYWSFGYIRWSIVKHEVTPTLQVPTVFFQVAILIGALIMVAYFMREAFDLAARAYRGLPADTDSGEIL